MAGSSTKEPPCEKILRHVFQPLLPMKLRHKQAQLPVPRACRSGRSVSSFLSRNPAEGGGISNFRYIHRSTQELDLHTYKKKSKNVCMYSFCINSAYPSNDIHGRGQYRPKKQMVQPHPYTSPMQIWFTAGATRHTEHPSIPSERQR